ncbi:MAG: PDZ domain-containing protein, partial [Myxococcales bacterium]|nr:PDZ domain-containing protein [Myxococcales bacterium]
YANTDKLIAVPLNADVENPRLLKSDDETWEEPEEADEDKADDSGKADDGGEAKPEDADKGDKDEAAPDESGEAKDGSGQADDKKSGDESDDPYAGLNKDHPLFGKWEGTAKGFKAIGAPDDEVSFTLTIIVDEDGNIMGTSESQGESKDLGDVVKWDEAKQEFYRERAQGPVKVVMTGTVSDDDMNGTWSIEMMGASGTWTAHRTTRDIDADEVKKIRGESGDGETKPVEIDLDGFEARGMELPVEPGSFWNLASNDSGNLLYVRGTIGGPPAIKLIDITADEPEEKTVLGAAGGFDISGDGKKILAGGQGGFAIVDAKPGQSFSKALRPSGLRKMVDPRAEWEEMFTDAWRRYRDFFYVKNMHGVDWDAVHERYQAMLADAATREDVAFIIGEMISELNVGHAYYFGGDFEGQPSEPVGLLGVDFALGTETDDEGNAHTAYKIEHMYHGAPWDSDARGPLNQPGLDVKEGDYITAVNGVAIDTALDPWASFIGLAGRDTTLTVASKLVGDDEARNE